MIYSVATRSMTESMRRLKFSPAANSGSQPDGNQSRLAIMLKKYGKIGLVVWIVVSIVVLLGCYVAIELGVDTVCNQSMISIGVGHGRKLLT